MAFDREFRAPVNVGDEVEVTIEAVGEKGDGVAKIKGFVIFVPNVKEGETVKIRVNKVLKKVGFGEVIGKGTAAAPMQAPKKPEEVPESEDFGEEPEQLEEPSEPAEQVEDDVEEESDDQEK